MSDGEMVILGAVLWLGGAAIAKIELVLAKLHGHLNLSETGMALLAALGGLVVFSFGLVRVLS